MPSSNAQTGEPRHTVHHLPPGSPYVLVSSLDSQPVPAILPTLESALTRPLVPGLATVWAAPELA